MNSMRRRWYISTGQMPKYEILKKEMGEVIVASPFKAEMEKEFGTILIQNMEARNSFLTNLSWMIR